MTTHQPPSHQKHIYKILPTAPPSPLPQLLPLSTLDTSSGYIHLSTATQTPATAGRFFDSNPKLWILVLRLDTFDTGRENGEIRWEVAGDDGVFPHLYGGGLGAGVVEEVLEFEKGDRGWEEVLGGLKQ